MPVSYTHLDVYKRQGYNAEMMKIVAAEAAKKGYKPDACFTPDDKEGKGRPYP